jgi:hypothetical protein
MWNRFKFNRTIALGGLALFLALLTLIDQVNDSQSRLPSGRGAVNKGHSAAREIAENTVAGAPTVGLWGQIVALRYFLENGDLIRKRYQLVSVPYAEAVAPVAALYSVGEQPKAVVTRAIQSLVDPNVQVKAMLISEGASTKQGVSLFSVGLSLESGDSQALLRSLLALGDAGGGSIWKEISLGVDSDRRVVQVGGTLTVLAIQQAE